jgi:hypothetical protein
MHNTFKSWFACAPTSRLCISVVVEFVSLRSCFGAYNVWMLFSAACSWRVVLRYAEASFPRRQDLLCSYWSALEVSASIHGVIHYPF